MIYIYLYVIHTGGPFKTDMGALSKKE